MNGTKIQLSSFLLAILFCMACNNVSQQEEQKTADQAELP